MTKKKGIIVQILGGLGNQMFQYALFQAFLEQGKDAKMDLTWFKTNYYHNGYELSRVFDIKEVYAAGTECERYNETRFFSRAWRRFIPKTKDRFTAYRKAIYFVPEVLSMNNKYMQGYWQCEKYFKQIEGIIRKDFVFKRPLGEQASEIAKEIRSTNSVSIHIRSYNTGEISSTKGKLNLGGVCTLDYYRNAITKMEKSVKEPRFFIFSDDIKWCEGNIRPANSVYVDCNRGTDSYKDMQLMSLCKHNIIANSSFSWWGAWLNQNKDKIVIAPDKWYLNGPYDEDIVPNDWVRIKTK